MVLSCLPCKDHLTALCGVVLKGFAVIHGIELRAIS